MITDGKHSVPLGPGEWRVYVCEKEPDVGRAYLINKAKKPIYKEWVDVLDLFEETSEDLIISIKCQMYRGCMYMYSSTLGEGCGDYYRDMYGEDRERER